MEFPELLVNMRVVQNLVARNWETLSGDQEPLSLYQCAYLLELGKGESLRPAELAGRMGCEVRNARPFMDRLHARGLIEQKRVSFKSMHLSLSKKGRAAVARFRAAMEAMEATCMGDIPPSEIEIAHKVIRQLLERSR